MQAGLFKEIYLIRPELEAGGRHPSSPLINSA